MCSVCNNAVILLLIGRNAIAQHCGSSLNSRGIGPENRRQSEWDRRTDALIKGTIMSKKLFRDTLLASTVIAGMTVVAMPAVAQTVPQEAVTEAQDGAAEGEEIVVTGTLIRNPNLETSSPVNVTSGSQMSLKIFCAMFRAWLQTSARRPTTATRAHRSSIFAAWARRAISCCSTVSGWFRPTSTATSISTTYRSPCLSASMF